MNYIKNEKALLDDGGLRYLVEQLIKEIKNGSITVDLSNYVTKDAMEEAIKEAGLSIDLSDYATEEYVRTKIAEAQVAGSGVDLSDYALKSELAGKASTSHTHVLSDITDYTATDLTGLATTAYVENAIDAAKISGGECECDLSGYALKEELPDMTKYALITYVENLIVNANSDSEIRVLATIDGTRVYTKNNIEPIPTYDGGTTITFPTEVTLRIYTEENGVLNVDKYAEYTGTSITIPDTKDGSLRDYVIYNICPSSSNTIADPNILATPVEGRWSSTADGINYFNHDNETEGFALKDTNDYVYTVNETYSFEDYQKIYYGRKDDVSEYSYSTNSTNYVGRDGDATFSEKIYEVEKKLWLDNISEIKSFETSDKYTESSIYNALSDLLNLSETEYKKMIPPTVYLNSPINGYQDRSSYNASCFGNQLNIHPLDVVCVAGQTYTIESLDGKPFAVKGFGWGSEYAKCIYDKALWKIKGTEIESPIGAVTCRYYASYDSRTLSFTKAENLSDQYKYYLSMPLYQSSDGSAITFTVPDNADTSNYYEPLFRILCKEDSDYDSIKITKGTASYSSQMSGNNIQTIVTVSNSDGTKTGNVTFEMFNYTIEKEYVRYLDDKIYKIYELDDFVKRTELSDYYTKSEIDAKLSNNSSSSDSSSSNGITYILATETLTSDTWIDNKPIYRYVVEIPAGSDTTTYTTTTITGIFQDISTFIDARVMWTHGSASDTVQKWYPGSIIKSIGAGTHNSSYSSSVFDTELNYNMRIACLERASVGGDPYVGVIRGKNAATDTATMIIYYTKNS